MGLVLLTVLGAFLKVYIDFEGLFSTVFQRDMMRDMQSVMNGVTRTLNRNEYGNSINKYRMESINRASLRYNLNYLNEKLLNQLTTEDDVIEELKAYYSKQGQTKSIYFSLYSPTKQAFLFGGDYLKVLEKDKKSSMVELSRTLMTRKETFQSTDLVVAQVKVDTVDLMAQKHKPTGNIIIASISRNQLFNQGVISNNRLKENSFETNLPSPDDSGIIMVFNKNGEMIGTNSRESYAKFQYNQEGSTLFSFAEGRINQLVEYKVSYNQEKSKYFVYSAKYQDNIVVVLKEFEERSLHFVRAMYIVSSLGLLLIAFLLFVFKVIVQHKEVDSI